GHLQRGGLRDGDGLQLQQPPARRRGPGGRHGAPPHPPARDLRRPGASRTRSVTPARRAVEDPAMLRRLICLAGALGTVLSVGLVAPAQPKGKGKEDDKETEYRKSFKTPKTPLEAWDALQYEIESGRYDLAGLYLRELNTKMKPSPDDFLNIHKR